MIPRILITGGAGFIGSHLAEALVKKARLVLFDNLRRDSLSGVPALRSHPGIRLVQGDVLDRRALTRAASGVETVFHLAAIAGVSSYYSEPLKTLQVNLLGTVNALEAAVASGVKRFVYLSTSEIYGPDALWVDEGGFGRIGPATERRWCYATSKLASEQFVLRYGEAHGIATAILRPFNIYGPRQTGEGAISNFCSAAAGGRPMTVYGDGAALRAWCYVSDFVAAAQAVLSRRAAGEIFNIGNPREVETTLGLARRIARMTGAPIRFKAMKRAEVRGRVPCIDKARRLLGFAPKVDLEEGLRRTLEWRRRS